MGSLEFSKRLSFISSLILIALSVAPSVLAVNELTMFSTRLNWFDGNDSDSTRGFNRTLLVSWSGGVPGGSGLFVDLFLNRSGSSNFNFTVANNCGFGPSTANCTCDSASQKANCTIFSSVSIPFGVTWNGTAGPLVPAELTLLTTSANATNGSSSLAFNAANVSWIRIPESKLFHTLVEFGRGRGNYFFDSAGRETSAGIGVGQPFLPNGTRIELTYLHKVFNVRQYFRLPLEKAENATWRCTFPNVSVVRSHLTTDILRTAGTFNASFKIPEIEGSFERQGFLSQQFEPSQLLNGQSHIINCTNFAYTLGNASGNISADVDDFNLSVRDRESINFTASTGTTVIGNGTQEVIINYTIQNKEVFPVTDVIVEIGSPLFSKFIGTRAELWGSGEAKFEIRRAQIPPGGRETIELVARFNTSDAPDSLTNLNLSGPSVISVVNPWDKNAYNPAETIYNFQDRHTVSVNLAQNVRVEPLTDVIQLVRNLTNLTFYINQSMFSINSSLRDVLQGINQSLLFINQTIVDRLARVNESLFTINQTLVDRLVGINVTMLTINQTLVDRLVGINRSMFELLLNLTNLTQSISVNVSVNTTVILEKIQGLNVSMQVINQTLVDRLVGFNNSLQAINQSLFDFLVAFNISTFNSLAALLNLSREINITVHNITVSGTDDLRVRLDRIEEFQNEVVFLVTDSFGMEQAAVRQIDQGDFGAAVKSLTRVNQDLDRLADRIATERSLALSEPNPQGPIQKRVIPTSSGASNADVSGTAVSWITVLNLIAVMIMIMMVGHHIYVVRQKDDEDDDF